MDVDKGSATTRRPHVFPPLFRQRQISSPLYFPPLPWFFSPRRMSQRHYKFMKKLLQFHKDAGTKPRKKMARPLTPCQKTRTCEQPAGMTQTASVKKKSQLTLPRQQPARTKKRLPATSPCQQPARADESVGRKTRYSGQASASDESEGDSYVDGVVQGTRRRRESMLERLKHLIDPTRPTWSWEELLRHQLAYAQTHGRGGGTQRASSVKTLLERTIGMVRRYFPEMGRPPQEFLATIEQQQYLAFREGAQRATPATWETIQDLIHRLNSTKQQPAALFLLLAWVTCSRGTSIAKLQPRNISFAGPLSSPWVTTHIRFCEGKTLRSTGPYLLTVELRQKDAATLASQMISRAQKLYLFPTRTQAQVAALLKAVQMEIRSIRRGSIQALALSGMPPEQILMFSRHKDRSGLTAYLGEAAIWESSIQRQGSRTLQESFSTLQ